MIDIFKALLTPVLALFGLYIAWQQFQLAKQKVKLDLFDRRQRVFRAVTELASTVVRHGSATDTDAIKLLGETADAEFLFGPEIATYIDDMYHRAIQLAMRAEEVRLGDAEDHSAAVRAKWEQVKWFDRQIREARQLFGPYLALTLK